MTWCLLQTTLLKWFSIWFVLHPNAILLLDNGMLTYSWIGWLKQYIVKNVSWYPEIINTNDKRNKKGRVILTKCTTTLTATKKMRKRKGKEGSFYSYLVCKRPYCISWTLEFSDKSLLNARTHLFLLSLQWTRFGEVTEWTDKPTVKVAVTVDAPAVVKLIMERLMDSWSIQRSDQ